MHASVRQAHHAEPKICRTHARAHQCGPCTQNPSLYELQSRTSSSACLYGHSGSCRPPRAREPAQLVVLAIGRRARVCVCVLQATWQWCGAAWHARCKRRTWRSARRRAGATRRTGAGTGTRLPSCTARAANAGTQSARSQPQRAAGRRRGGFGDERAARGCRRRESARVRRCGTRDTRV